MLKVSSANSSDPIRMRGATRVLCLLLIALMVALFFVILPGGTAHAALINTITASAGANGSITPSGTVLVILGFSQTFSMTANSGYHVSDVLVDGASVVTDRS